MRETGSRRLKLEVCVATVEDALAADAGGADRLELNTALELGGLTPPVGLIREVLTATRLPVVAMNRPRPAGFCYSAREKLQLLRDAEALLAEGVHGIAAGVIAPDSSIDWRIWRELVKICRDREIVFHRAFDVLPEPQAALAILIDAGTSRVLTSGGAESALAGALRIKELRAASSGRIEILPGAGVTAETIKMLICQTGCDQVHGSFSIVAQDSAGVVADDHYRRTSRERVAAARRALDVALDP